MEFPLCDTFSSSKFGISPGFADPVGNKEMGVAGQEDPTRIWDLLGSASQILFIHGRGSFIPLGLTHGQLLAQMEKKDGMEEG